MDLKLFLEIVDEAAICCIVLQEMRKPKVIVRFQGDVMILRTTIQEFLGLNMDASMDFEEKILGLLHLPVEET
jgi:hypothetical protein